MEALRRARPTRGQGALDDRRALLRIFQHRRSKGRFWTRLLHPPVYHNAVSLGSTRELMIVRNGLTSTAFRMVIDMWSGVERPVMGLVAPDWV